MKELQVCSRHRLAVVLLAECTFAKLYSYLQCGLRLWHMSYFAVAGIFEGSKAKPRKFTETIELQVRAMTASELRLICTHIGLLSV